MALRPLFRNRRHLDEALALLPCQQRIFPLINIYGAAMEKIQRQVSASLPLTEIPSCSPYLLAPPKILLTVALRCGCEEIEIEATEDQLR